MVNTVAVNYAACIKQEAHWGYDKFHNICTGTWNSVPWGSFDWTAHVVAGSIMLSVVTVVAVFGALATASIIEDYRFYRS